MKVYLGPDAVSADGAKDFTVTFAASLADATKISFMTLGTGGRTVPLSVTLGELRSCIGPLLATRITPVSSS